MNSGRDPAYVAVTVEERKVPALTTKRSIVQITKEAVRVHTGLYARYYGEHPTYQDVKRWATKNKLRTETALVIRSAADGRWLCYKLPAGKWQTITWRDTAEETPPPRKREPRDPTREEAQDPAREERTPTRQTPSGGVNAAGGAPFDF